VTPAEELRAAAKLMRERAEAATPGPWKHMCMGSEGCITIRASGTIRERGHGRVAKHGWKDWQADHADAEFVASVHPGVALAVADWLDMAVSCGCEPGDDHADIKAAALAVARAYLGVPEGETP